MVPGGESLASRSEAPSPTCSEPRHEASGRRLSRQEAMRCHEGHTEPTEGTTVPSCTHVLLERLQGNARELRERHSEAEGHLQGASHLRDLNHAARGGQEELQAGAQELVLKATNKTLRSTGEKASIGIHSRSSPSKGCIKGGADDSQSCNRPGLSCCLPCTAARP